MSKSFGRDLPIVVKVSHCKSSSKINIPVILARATGIDEAAEVIVIRRGDKKIEVKRYDKEEDLKEYLSYNKDGFD